MNFYRLKFFRADDPEAAEDRLIIQEEMIAQFGEKFPIVKHPDFFELTYLVDLDHCSVTLEETVKD